MQRRGLPIAYVVAAGNQAQTGLSAIASGLIEDPRVTAVGLHIEGIDDVAALRAHGAPRARARQADRRDDRRALGAVARRDHLAYRLDRRLGGGDGCLLRPRSACRALRSIPEFLETLKLLHVHGPLPGGDLCSMSCSGGEAALIADAALGRRRRVPPARADEERARVKATLGDLVTVANPLDYHTFVWAKEEAMTATFSAMMRLRLRPLDAGARFSAHGPLRRRRRLGRRACARFRSSRRETGARTAVVATLPENMPEERAAAFMAEGIAPLCGDRRGARRSRGGRLHRRELAEPLPQRSRPILAGRGRDFERGCPRTLVRSRSESRCSPASACGAEIRDGVCDCRGGGRGGGERSAIRSR